MVNPSSINMENQKHGRKVRLNRYFITICSTLVSLNNEFGIETNSILKLFDKVTLIWSFIALTTNFFKYLQFQQLADLGPRDQNNTNQFNCREKYHYELKFKDLILLNYFPCINELGPLHYSLSSVTIGSLLIWRLYLNYYRPLFDWKNPSTKVCHDGIVEMMRFFVYGPNNDTKQIEEKELSDTNELELTRARQHHSHLFVELDHGKSYKLFNPKLRSDFGKVLGKSWRKNVSTFSASFDEINESYENPIRKHNFFTCQSDGRWNFMIKRIIIIGFINCLATIPIFWYIIKKLRTELAYYALRSNEGQNDFRIDFLYYYGVAELFYCYTQGALFFVFTNLFLVIFHSDLTYLFGYITKDVNLLWDEIYIRAEPTGILTPGPHDKDLNERILMIQTRLWAYFDHIKKIDSFVSSYSFASNMTLVAGIIFGQGYIKVQEATIRRGALAILFANFISFTTLYMISWDIEKRVS